MNPIFTKDTLQTKITDKDIEIYSQLIELKYNKHTKLENKYPTDFKLTEDQYQQYQPYLFNVLNKLELKYFVKALLSDVFKLSYTEVKSKVFLKCYIQNNLVLEISITKSQFEAILLKYNIEINDLISNDKFYLYYAGTFYKDQDILKSKLTDLKLIKIAYEKY